MSVERRRSGGERMSSGATWWSLRPIIITTWYASLRSAHADTDILEIEMSFSSTYIHIDTNTHMTMYNNVALIWSIRHNLIEQVQLRMKMRTPLEHRHDNRVIQATNILLT